jgi:hypothetical protein
VKAELHKTLGQSVDPALDLEGEFLAWLTR